MATIRPDSIDALCDAIRQARASGGRLAISGGGSKADVGAPQSADRLDMRGLRGIIDYDPAELVLTAYAGTPLTEIEAALADKGQMLAFDPWDHGPLFGRPAGDATLGGVVAAGVAGPRRLSAGGARDHLLGFTAVSGKGDRFVAGGKVVKNVTGFDIAKLMAGSWGRLAAMTEVTVKVLPRPRVSATLAADRLTAALARTLMLGALGGSSSVAAAAHLPAAAHDGDAITLLRLEGFGPSVEARAQALAREHGGMLERLTDDRAAALWARVRCPAHLSGRTLWRAQLPALASASLVEELEPQGAQCLIDWGGSLLWIGWDGPPDVIRPLIEGVGGHAMLVRAPADVRARLPFQHPRASAVMTLEARVRAAFDPDGVFETGRFGEAG
ncbi:MAG: glycolate oxidase subunit GlcE [Sphingomonas sp.]|nr:glycolate oxidase subunit GlcE [Sphingomonas sp.]